MEWERWRAGQCLFPLCPTSSTAFYAFVALFVEPPNKENRLTQTPGKSPRQGPLCSGRVTGVRWPIWLYYISCQQVMADEKERLWWMTNTKTCIHDCSRPDRPGWAARGKRGWIDRVLPAHNQFPSFPGYLTLAKAFFFFFAFLKGAHPCTSSWGPRDRSLLIGWFLLRLSDFSLVGNITDHGRILYQTKR